MRNAKEELMQLAAEIERDRISAGEHVTEALKVLDRLQRVFALHSKNGDLLVSARVDLRIALSRYLGKKK